MYVCMYISVNVYVYMYVCMHAYIRKRACIYVSIVKPTRCTNVSNLFYFGKTVHVSDGLSVHHQEFETVHTATGICQTDTATAC